MRATCRFSLFVALGLTACGTKNDDTNLTASATNPQSDDSSGGGDSGPAGEGSGDTGPVTTSPGTTEAGDETSPAASSGGGEGFITPPDGGGVSNECDIWAQDCAEGQKCMPWANDGGNSWNATKCSVLDANPAQPGDPCTVEGSGVSGIDNCDISSMCWNVDGETNMGVCVGFCEGSEQNPTCSDPDTGCSVSNEGVLILCLLFCDPLLQDCSMTEACYGEENGFFCSPDASGGDEGGYGDACEFLNACDAGLFCAEAVSVPDCVDAAGCCSEFCDLTDPAAMCMGQGQECTAWYAEGQAPPGYEDVGACVIPA